MSTPMAKFTSWSMLTTFSLQENQMRSHEFLRRYRPRCCFAIQAPAQQTTQSISSEGRLQTEETILKSLWETATSTTFLKKQTYKRQQQPSLQVPAPPHIQQNRMNFLTQKSTPTTGAWSESYSGFRTHDLT